MQRAISETQRRRKLQQEYNIEHGIDPQTIRKAVTDILAYLRQATTARPPRQARPKADPARPQASAKKRADDGRAGPTTISSRLILTLEEEMHEASADLRFEYAARLRDEIKELRRELRQFA